MKSYDTIVVGAGIQGLLVALECVGRGQNVLLVDKDNAGSATSDNSFGIVHGGLRYLQTLDLSRWRRSRLEQAWFLREFPDLVRPITCVMPLYKGAFRNRLTFAAAFALEAYLSRSLRGAPALPQGRIMPRARVLKEFPDVVTEGMTGAAEWHDVSLLDPPALMRRLVSHFQTAGGQFAEGHEVVDFKSERGEATGIVVQHRNSQNRETFGASRVVLCVGPWSAALAHSAGLADKRLACEALAFNLLLDVAPPYEQGIAVSVKPGRGRSYFLRPYQGKLFAGTYYCDRAGVDPGAVDAGSILAFKRDLAQCVPNLGLEEARVLRVTAGSLPAQSAGRLASSDLIVDHGASGGVRGIFTVLGVKLTTARALAQRTVDLIWPLSSHPADAAALKLR